MVNKKHAKQLTTRETGPVMGFTVPPIPICEAIYMNNNIYAIFFISIYCLHCVDLLPHLIDIKNKYNVEMVLFSNGDNEDNYEIEQYFDFNFPVISLEKQDMENIFNITALPFVLIVDENKKVVAKSVVYNADDFTFLFDQWRKNYAT